MASAGALRERVTIEQVATTRDAVGGLVETWTTLATVWAALRPASTRETYQRQQMAASAGWTVEIRYRAEVTAKMRVVWGSRRFVIRGVTNADLHKRYLTLACDELAAP